MFERYTEKARRAIFFARFQASRFESSYIESEHLLLGLLRESKALHRLFASSPAAVDIICNQIERHSTSRARFSTSVELPLDKKCKRILIIYAAEEADALAHKHIGTEHLLLGLLREQSCYAAQVLRDSGVTLDSARALILNGIGEEAVPRPKPEGAKASLMADRAVLHQLVDALPEEALDATFRVLENYQKWPPKGPASE